MQRTIKRRYAVKWQPRVCVTHRNRAQHAGHAVHIRANDGVVEVADHAVGGVLTGQEDVAESLCRLAIRRERRQQLEFHRLPHIVRSDLYHRQCDPNVTLVVGRRIGRSAKSTNANGCARQLVGLDALVRIQQVAPPGLAGGRRGQTGIPQHATADMRLAATGVAAVGHDLRDIGLADLPIDLAFDRANASAQ
jgi:hypothetical protein